MSVESRACFLGSRFHLATIEEAARDILSAGDGPFKFVVTPNVHHIVMLHDNPHTLRPLYERAWRTYCDSRVLALLSRLTGGPRLPVITGSDLTAYILGRAAERRIRVSIVGPSKEDCEALQKLYPGLDLVVHTPPMGFIKSSEAVQECIDFVVREKSKLVLLATGAPQQEVLADRIAATPGAVGVALCIGASIDFLTGKQQRAPIWFQKAGLEWLHRLSTNPRRLATRYLVECPKIFYLLLANRTAA
ncbi:MAG: WecB/TagA/CpsF family glycosyltransferase [Proteobacteria bacterium]|nr:WecB/TagA/CpsF family glycosyltransferase [Pseudomonadota bacterium]